MWRNRRLTTTGKFAYEVWLSQRLAEKLAIAALVSREHLWCLR